MKQGKVLTKGSYNPLNLARHDHQHTVTDMTLNSSFSIETWCWQRYAVDMEVD